MPRKDKKKHKYFTYQELSVFYNIHVQTMYKYMAGVDLYTISGAIMAIRQLDERLIGDNYETHNNDNDGPVSKLRDGRGKGVG